MKENIWQSLPVPFLVQAPMEHVTDTVFRQIIASATAPHLFFTEFTSVEGLDSKGVEEVKKRLIFTEKETPIIAQVWGKTPEKYKKASQMIVSMGFDGIDINMGCPDRTVMRNGCCAALITNPNLAKEIISAVKEGTNGTIPVSVKTRIGTNQIVTEEWTSFLLDQDIDALTIHGRTAKEQSLVPAHWDEIGKVPHIRDQKGKSTVIIGNGDVMTYADAVDKATVHNLDGIMIGRGIFQNLWIFDPKKNPETITKSEKLMYLKKHITLFGQTWGTSKDFNIMKKFYKIYVSGFENASELRAQLMEFQNENDTLAFLETIE